MAEPEEIASDETALAALRSALEGAAAAPPGEPEPAAAVARLAALPAPEGRHPFVADIFPALEGMHAALAAVGASAVATLGFARRRST